MMMLTKKGGKVPEQDASTGQLYELVPAYILMKEVPSVRSLPTTARHEKRKQSVEDPKQSLRKKSHKKRKKCAKKDDENQQKADRPRALLLGMVQSAGEILEPSLGQKFRDGVRCAAMEEDFRVTTFDDKHDASETPLQHVSGNFNRPRRWLSQLQSQCDENNASFQIICLDYFFSPASWAADRWSSTFFSETLPQLARSSVLAPRCEVWLPRFACVDAAISEHRLTLEQCFRIDTCVSQDNPLCRATDTVTSKLRLCHPPLDNANQLLPLKESVQDGRLFYRLTATNE